MSKQTILENTPPSRQEVTVVFIDIVGYTRLMEKDEADALAKLNYFKENLETRLANTSGKIIQYYGDAALATFQTPEEALTCAMELQNAMQQFAKVPLRVGIHIGDVVYKNNNIFGDTVNVASRLESMGVTGSVLFSQKVKNAVAGNPKFDIKEVGKFKLKNVEQLMLVFGLANEGCVIPAKKAIEKKIAQPDSIFSQPTFRWLMIASVLILIFGGTYFLKNGNIGKNSIAAQGLISPSKSIAVLPFANLSGNEENKYFCDGMMEDILNRLSSLKDLRVISRTSVLKYRDTEKPIKEVAERLGVTHILEGSIRRFGDQMRINVNLIYAKTDQQMWSESYDRIVDDIFGVQSEIAENIGEGLELTFLPKESLLIDYEPTKSADAYDLFLKGRDQFHIYQENRSEALLNKTEEYFENAVALDANLASAWAYLGRINILKHTFFGAGPDYIDTAMIYIEKSIQLYPNSAEAHLFRSEVYELRGQLTKMEIDLKQALALAPNNIEVLRLLGNYYVRETDDLEKSIPYFKKAIRLEPFSVRPIIALSNVHRLVGNIEKTKYYITQAAAIEPERLSIYMRLADINMLDGNFKAAQKASKKILEINPEFIWGHHIMAESYAFNGEYEVAEKYYRKIQKAVAKEGFVESYGSPPFRHRLGFVLSKNEKGAEAQKLFQQSIDKNLKIVDSDIDNHGGARYDLAATYAYMGNEKKAIYWLNRIFKDRSWFDNHYLNIDPMFEPLKKNKEFQIIMKRERKRNEEKRKRVKQMESVDFFN